MESNSYFAVISQHKSDRGGDTISEVNFSFATSEIIQRSTISRPFLRIYRGSEQGVVSLHENTIDAATGLGGHSGSLGKTTMSELDSEAIQVLISEVFVRAYGDRT